MNMLEKVAMAIWSTKGNGPWEVMVDWAHGDPGNQEPGTLGARAHPDAFTDAKADYEQVMDEARAAIEALMEPDEGMSIAGLTVLCEKLETQKKWWELPEQQERDTGDYPRMPTLGLTLRNSGESNAVFRAMLSHILAEEK